MPLFPSSEEAVLLVCKAMHRIWHKEQLSTAASCSSAFKAKQSHDHFQSRKRCQATSEKLRLDQQRSHLGRSKRPLSCPRRAFVAIESSVQKSLVVRSEQLKTAKQERNGIAADSPRKSLTLWVHSKRSLTMLLGHRFHHLQIVFGSPDCMATQTHVLRMGQTFDTGWSTCDHRPSLLGRAPVHASRPRGRGRRGQRREHLKHTRSWGKVLFL